MRRTMLTSASVGYLHCSLPIFWVLFVEKSCCLIMMCKAMGIGMKRKMWEEFTFVTYKCQWRKFELLCHQLTETINNLAHFEIARDQINLWFRLNLINSLKRDLPRSNLHLCMFLFLMKQLFGTLLLQPVNNHVFFELTSSLFLMRIEMFLFSVSLQFLTTLLCWFRHYYHFNLPHWLAWHWWEYHCLWLNLSFSMHFLLVKFV